MPNAESQLDTRTKITVKEPPKFKVIYLNDDRTAMEFVVESLVQHFNYTVNGAEKITIDIHEAGAATVAVLPYEVAEQKGIEITMQARAMGYPLQIKLEPDVY